MKSFNLYKIVSNTLNGRHNYEVLVDGKEIKSVSLDDEAKIINILTEQSLSERLVQNYEEPEITEVPTENIELTPEEEEQIEAEIEKESKKASKLYKEEKK